MSMVLVLPASRCLTWLLHLMATVSLGHSSRCYYKYMERKYGRSGSFESPDFPRPYGSDLDCIYSFEASEDGRVRLKFEVFQLRPGTASGCKDDYIDVIIVDNSGSHILVNRYCGEKTPKVIVSPFRRLQIIFHTDLSGGRYRGFRGSYEFLDQKYVPSAPDPRCGPVHLTGSGGVILSPGYPNNLEMGDQCTWVIRTEKQKRILLLLETLTFTEGRVRCHDAKSRLFVYNGYQSDLIQPERVWCGKIEPPNLDIGRKSVDEQEFTSRSHRVSIKLKTGSDLRVGSAGFRLSWTSYWVPRAGEVCHQHWCSGGKYCLDPEKQICHARGRYCIDKSLVCNGSPNCGLSDVDDSDERLCYLPYAIAGSVVGAVLLVTCLTVIIFRRFKHYKRERLRRNMVALTLKIAHNKQQQQQQPEQTADGTVVGNDIKHPFLGISKASKNRSLVADKTDDDTVEIETTFVDNIDTEGTDKDYVLASDRIHIYRDDYSPVLSGHVMPLHSRDLHNSRFVDNDSQQRELLPKPAQSIIFDTNSDELSTSAHIQAVILENPGQHSSPAATSLDVSSEIQLPTDSPSTQSRLQRKQSSYQMIVRTNSDSSAINV